MARTKGSKNKSKTQTAPINPMQNNASVVKKEKGAGLKAYRERKKAEKELAALQNEKTHHSHDEHLQVHNKAFDAVTKKDNAPLAMIRKILRSNEPQKCYLVIEF